MGLKVTDEKGNPVAQSPQASTQDKTQAKPPITKANLVGRENILHNYASYTYRLSLYMLSKEDYTTLSETPFAWRPKNCIVAGAGKHDPVMDRRHPEFKDDFYFDELKILTMVGLNARSKASNVLDLDFTLIEPYGLTFLDRLVQGSASVGSKNYLDMPYLLQIEFFGHTDDGVTDFKPIPGSTKRFPIRILAMEIDVSTKGSVYKIKASPYSHGAFDVNIATTPVNLQVTASTVAEFFASKETQGLGNPHGNKIAEATTRAENSRAAAVSGPDGGNGGLSMKPAPKVALKDLTISVDTYANGINQWFKYQVLEKAREHPDQVIFNFDTEIANSKIVRPEKTDASKTKLARVGTSQAAATQRGGGTGPDFNSKEFSVNAGTTIEKTIDMVMRNSDYVTGQLLDDKSINVKKMTPEEVAKALNKPFKWYKVIPSIKLGEFDEKANRFSKIIQYNVIQYIVTDTKHPHGPKTTPTYYHKTYDYLYSGRNRDVIDFKIQFNALYYNVVTINRSSAQTSTITPGGKEANTTEVKNPDGGANKVFPTRVEPIAGDVNASGVDTESDTRSITINDIQKNLYQNSKADMLNVQVDIIGDPDFIKQDDVFVNPSQSSYNDDTAGSYVGNTGSLAMDKGELYALVRWRTPTDIEPETGLIRNDGKYKESAFSGMYRILGVTSTFRQGQFKQSVDLIRSYKLESADTKNPERDQSFLKGRKVSTRVKPIAPLTVKKPIEIGGANTSSIKDSLGKTPGLPEPSSLDAIKSKVQGGLVSDLGGGLGALSDKVADLSTSFTSNLGIPGISNVLPGSIDELTGAIGTGTRLADIQQFAGVGSGVVQSGLNLVNKFNEGVGVAGAKSDLMQLASFVDGVDIDGVISSNAGSPETDNAPIITGTAKNIIT